MYEKHASPFNGDFYDSNGNIRNLMDIGPPEKATPKDHMSPFNGDFYASDGSVHNIDELGSGGGSNPNILHNWDFTQSINQRNIDSYTTTVNSPIYTIDRWVLSVHGAGNSGSYNIVTRELVSGTNEAGTARTTFYQLIEFPSAYSGKTYTLSAIFEEITGSALLRVDYNRLGGMASTQAIASNEYSEELIQTLTFQMPSVITDEDRVRVVIQTNGCAKLLRIKLESGAVSTIVNDPPQDYGIELAKCQRYQFAPGAIYIRADAYDTNTIRFRVLTPVTMRTNPTSKAVLCLSPVQLLPILFFDFDFSFVKTGGAIEIIAQKNEHGMTDATLIVTGNQLFDANL